MGHKGEKVPTNVVYNLLNFVLSLVCKTCCSQVVFNLQGDPCEVCPVLPADMGNTVALQGKPGLKGEPGLPGLGERGRPVSTAVTPRCQTIM